MSDKAFRKTECPICRTDVHDREVYPMNFHPDDLDAAVLSARRLPDRLHYRMVRCEGCGLLRSNPILDSTALERLYAASHFTYEEEADYARKTYAGYLEAAIAGGARRGRLLEIGCGSGFFLEEALSLGFTSVAGVEPSTEAIAHAPQAIRPFIRQGFYGPESFDPDSFDVICGFQVFDHVPDQAATLAACHRHLRPGGLLLFINHDSGALTSRLLGERSPIVDVEHTALFDKQTMARIVERAGFEVRSVFGVANRYPLRYWARLAPMPGVVKSAVLTFLEGTGLGGIAVRLRAGNLGLVAAKGAGA